MARSKVVRVTVIDEVVAQLEDAIVSGEYLPGAKLPGEGELASQLDVSRPILREALARLRERGYVRTVNGRGSFVQSIDPGIATETLIRQVRLYVGTEIALDDLYEVRRAIEARTAGLAAQLATPEDIALLDEHVNAMEASLDGDGGEYSGADTAFHLALAQASHNPLYPLLLGPVVELIVRSIYQSVRSNRERMESGIRDHRRIIERVRAQDSEGAVREIEDHLSRGRAMHSTTSVWVLNEPASGAL